MKNLPYILPWFDFWQRHSPQLQLPRPLQTGPSSPGSENIFRRQLLQNTNILKISFATLCYKIQIFWKYLSPLSVTKYKYFENMLRLSLLQNTNILTISFATLCYKIQISFRIKLYTAPSGALGVSFHSAQNQKISSCKKKWWWTQYNATISIIFQDKKTRIKRCCYKFRLGLSVSHILAWSATCFFILGPAFSRALAPYQEIRLQS